jgi:hypothetical protein
MRKKIHVLYESIESLNEQDWNSLMLLEPDFAITGCPNISLMLTTLIKYWENPVDLRDLQITNIIKSLNILFSYIFSFNSTDTILSIIGISNADSVFKRLKNLIVLNVVNDILVLELLKTIVCGFENPNQNKLLHYFITSPYLQLVTPDEQFSSSSVVPLILHWILANYKKYEILNPYLTEVKPLITVKVY